MPRAKDSLLDLERHRLQLEDNITKLRKALQLWKAWDAEYEALKEEVEAAPANPDGLAQELRRVRHEFQGELLHGMEIDDILRLEDLRSKDRIVSVLQRRVDYVTKNVESLQKQLEAAETKYAAATVISQPDATDEDGQPITEIIEELDDDDNVVSYRLNRPGDSLPHVRDALEKAGINHLADGEPESAQWPVKPPPVQTEAKPSQIPPEPTSQPEKASPRHTSAPRKTVSFSEGAEPTDAPAPDMSRRAKRVERIMRTAKEQESLSNEKPVVPEDEDSKDAALRQQMLQYSMGEVGAVVAEIQLEEDSDSDDDDEADDDDYDGEDKFGRSTRRVITDEYRQHMLELEKRLGIKSRFTQATERDEDDYGNEDDEGIGRIVVRCGSETRSSASRPAPSKSSIKDKQGDADAKKGVRFAQNLDIAPEEAPAALPVPKAQGHVVDPLSDVIERSGSFKATEPRAARNPSRFKQARNETSSSGEIPKGPFDVPAQLVEQGPREMPTATGPDGTILADQLVERKPASDPTPAGEFDDAMDHSTVADEYQRMRKKFIHRQGGFLKEDESPTQELTEAGMPQHISRFKAARLSRQ